MIWVLCLFQEYFTYIEPIVHQRWAEPEYPGKNHLTIRKQNMAFPHVTCDPSETRTTAVRNDEILVSVYLKNVHLI